MRKLLLLAAFFVATPALFAFSVMLLLFVSHHSGAFITSNNPYNRKVAFAALPTSQNVLGDTAQPADTRVEILRQFFAKYHSPLEPYAEEFIKKAEQYQLDFRLLPAIAMQETNLCLKSHADSYNCWGFGVHGGKYLYFDNYPHAIDTISKALAQRYRDQHGLVTPEEIQKLYNPTNTNSWAQSVDHFMNTLK
jgi:hypothetical protein